uniref:SH2 domain-containing protein n=1 Tax=Macrostomum lignano TaxID=282301 RepID=A0A1I8F3S1_9PLAT
ASAVQPRRGRIAAARLGGDVSSRDCRSQQFIWPTSRQQPAAPKLRGAAPAVAASTPGRRCANRRDHRRLVLAAGPRMTSCGVHDPPDELQSGERSLAEVFKVFPNLMDKFVSTFCSGFVLDNYDILGLRQRSERAYRRGFGGPDPVAPRQTRLVRTDTTRLPARSANETRAMHGRPQRVDNTGAFAAATRLQRRIRRLDGCPSLGQRHSQRQESAAAQQKLQQQQQQPTGPLSNNRMRTLTMSTPHLTRTRSTAHFNFVNHLALRDHTRSNRAGHGRCSSAGPAALLCRDIAGLLPSAVGYNSSSTSSLYKCRLSAVSSQAVAGSAVLVGWGSRASLATEQRAAVRSPLNRKCETGNGKSATPTASAEEAEPEQHGCCSDSRRRRLNTADSVFRSITPLGSRARAHQWSRAQSTKPATARGAGRPSNPERGSAHASQLPGERRRRHSRRRGIYAAGTENGGVYRSGHVTSAGDPSAAAISSLGKEGKLGSGASATTSRHLPPGRFIVRDSHSYPGGYGLAVKVAEGEGRPATSKGAAAKARCPNEPVFASLAALIYQHTVTQLALPCKLVLPPMPGSATSHTSSTKQPADLVSPAWTRSRFLPGAACNVLYLAPWIWSPCRAPPASPKLSTSFCRCRDRLRTRPCQFKAKAWGRLGASAGPSWQRDLPLGRKLARLVARRNWMSREMLSGWQTSSMDGFGSR